MANQPFSTSADYSLTIIPLFILMGVFAVHARLAQAGFDLAARVLGRIEPEDEAAVAAGERLAAEAALCAAEKGADFAMNKYNGPETVAS